MSTQEGTRGALDPVMAEGRWPLTPVELLDQLAENLRDDGTSGQECCDAIEKLARDLEAARKAEFFVADVDEVLMLVPLRMTGRPAWQRCHDIVKEAK